MSVCCTQYHIHTFMFTHSCLTQAAVQAALIFTRYHLCLCPSCKLCSLFSLLSAHVSVLHTISHTHTYMYTHSCLTQAAVQAALIFTRHHFCLCFSCKFCSLFSLLSAHVSVLHTISQTRRVGQNRIYTPYIW
jgi:hypothetical protein